MSVVSNFRGRQLCVEAERETSPEWGPFNSHFTFTLIQYQMLPAGAREVSLRRSPSGTRGLCVVSGCNAKEPHYRRTKYKMEVPILFVIFQGGTFPGSWRGTSVVSSNQLGSVTKPNKGRHLWSGHSWKDCQSDLQYRRRPWLVEWTQSPTFWWGFLFWDGPWFSGNFGGVWVSTTRR